MPVVAQSIDAPMPSSASPHGFQHADAFAAESMPLAAASDYEPRRLSQKTQTQPIIDKAEGSGISTSSVM